MAHQVDEHCVTVNLKEDGDITYTVAAQDRKKRTKQAGTDANFTFERVDGCLFRFGIASDPEIKRLVVHGGILPSAVGETARTYRPFFGTTQMFMIEDEEMGNLIGLDSDGVYTLENKYQYQLIVDGKIVLEIIPFTKEEEKKGTVFPDAVPGTYQFKWSIAKKEVQWTYESVDRDFSHSGCLHTTQRRMRTKGSQGFHYDLSLEFGSDTLESLIIKVDRDSGYSMTREEIKLPEHYIRTFRVVPLGKHTYTLKFDEKVVAVIEVE